MAGRSPAKRRRRLVAAILLAALCGSATTIVVVRLLGHGSPHGRPSAFSPGPPALPPAAHTLLGISVNRLFNDRTFSPAQIDSQLAVLKATGATDARSDALWEATEPLAPRNGVHHYDWRFDDAIAAALARHGLAWLPILDYSAPWAQSVPGEDHSPPSSSRVFAQYTAALTNRYGAHGSFWVAHPELPTLPVQTLEVWNEPDGSFWLPHPDAPRYADLYAAARAAAKEVEPGIRVIVGGLTSPATFLPAMMRARPGLAGRIDGVGVHPYAPNPRSILVKLRSDRKILEAIGLGSAPLYVTEFGWATSPPGDRNYLPAATRPAYIEQTIELLAHSDCGVAGVLLYTWITPQRVAADREDWFGIRSPSAATSDRDATSGFTAGISAAKLARAPARICRSG